MQMKQEKDGVRNCKQIMKCINIVIILVYFSLILLFSIPSIDIHPCMQALYMDKCVDVSTVIHWTRQFKQEVGAASLCEKARSGRLETATDKSHQEHVETAIRDSCQIEQKNSAPKLGNL
jgi:hypothetical protein